MIDYVTLLLVNMVSSLVVLATFLWWGIGFIVTDAGGVFAGVAIWKQNVKIVRIVAGAVMLTAAGLWIPTTCMAYWLHMKVETPASSAADSGPPTGQNPVDTPIVADP